MNAVRINYYGQFLALVRNQVAADRLTNLFVKAHNYDQDCFDYVTVQVPAEVLQND